MQKLLYYFPKCRSIINNDNLVYNVYYTYYKYTYNNNII